MNEIRRTKIIATIGPASEKEEVMRDMMLAGMNCARFNFSHGTHAEQLEKMNRIKKVREELGLPIAIMLDTKGPEIRLKKFENGSVLLKAEDTFTLTPENVLGTQERASITYGDLYQSLDPGDELLVDDGKIELEVVKLDGKDIVCRVVTGGKVSDRKGINVPNIAVEMPYISAQDKADILFGLEQRVDYIAMSFVRSREDVLAVRSLLKDHEETGVKLIAKIENMQGIRNVDEILEAADGLMVARGDLGVEVPFAKLPYMQKAMIEACYKKGKLVITATQMLESMITSARPTRAEISDVANAVYDGSSAVMLSGETAAGSYPVESVKTMAEICLETESHINYEKKYENVFNEIDMAKEARRTIILAAYTAAKYRNAKAIVVATKAGKSAGLVSSVKPPCVIVAGTNSQRVQRQLNLQWGVYPLLMDTKDNSDELIQECIDQAEALPFIFKGDALIILGNTILGDITDFLKIHVFKEK